MEGETDDDGDEVDNVEVVDEQVTSRRARHCHARTLIQTAIQSRTQIGPNGVTGITAARVTSGAHKP